MSACSESAKNCESDKDKDDTKNDTVKIDEAGTHAEPRSTKSQAASQPSMTPASDLSAISAVPPFNQVDTIDIIRQVEYYFSDQNLPYDHHLLGLTGGDGNGAVKLGEILGFRKMRKYKPRSVVVEVLRRSAVLDLPEGGKYVKRRFPMLLKPTVRPEIDLRRQHIESTLAANPHLTKQMLKPTGFEEYFTGTPITPEQYQRDLKLYDPEFSFETRIENAIRHYRVKRKMHQSTLQVFDSWMRFGGIDTSPNAFQGGLSKDELAELDKDEIAAAKYSYTVDDYILDNENDYKIDFKLSALGYLSESCSQIMDVHNACNVMTNFINYILHHDVCKEYRDNLLDARKALVVAEAQLLALPNADHALHNGRTFDAACTLLHEDNTNDWQASKNVDLGTADAELVFKIGLLAFCTEEQRITAEQRFSNSTIMTGAASLQKTSFVSPFQVTISEDVGLEVIRLEYAQHDVSELFTSLHGTVPKMGIMHCRQWKTKGAFFADLPADRLRLAKDLKFIVDETVLKACPVGIKILAHVKQLDLGICWLDQIYSVLPNFYIYIPDFRQTKQRRRRVEFTKEWLADKAQLVEKCKQSAEMILSTTSTALVTA